MKREIEFNKLVRDKIPEIIKNGGDTCSYHVATTEEYRVLLADKLREEIEELINNPCAEEIADVLEVVETIARLNLISLDDVKIAKTKKKAECGGFAGRVVLEATTNNHDLKVIREGSHVHLDLGNTNKLSKDFKTSGTK